jgi:hypothetical protein
MERNYDEIEKRVQQMLTRSRPIYIDGASVYILSFRTEYYIRYVDGDKHITADISSEYIGEPWYYWLSNIARYLFASKIHFVRLISPVCWDYENDPIPEERLRDIIPRIEQALSRKYRRYKVELSGLKGA